MDLDDYPRISTAQCCFTMDGKNVSQYAIRMELTFKNRYHIKARMHYHNGDVVDYTVKNIIKHDGNYPYTEIQLLANTRKCIAQASSVPRPINYVEYFNEEKHLENCKLFKKEIPEFKNLTNKEILDLYQDYIRETFWSRPDIDEIKNTKHIRDWYLNYTPKKRLMIQRKAIKRLNKG